MMGGAVLFHGDANKVDLSPPWMHFAKPDLALLPLQKALAPANTGRWDWILVVVADLYQKQIVIPEVQRLLAPSRLILAHRGETTPTHNCCSFGVALVGGFHAVEFRGTEAAPLFLPATSGPLSPSRPGEPPTLWPGPEAHGLARLAETPVSAADLNDLLADPGASRLWHLGLTFRLPEPNKPILYLRNWPNIQTATLVSRADLGPLHGVHATPETTVHLDKLFPIPVVRTLLRAM